MWATTTLMDLVGPDAWSTEYPLEKLFRDAKIYQLFEGTAEIQRMVISRMQAAEYAERLGYGAEVAAEAMKPQKPSRPRRPGVPAPANGDLMAAVLSIRPLKGRPTSLASAIAPSGRRPCPRIGSLASLAMPQIRPALAALLAASAALIVLLLACAPASAEDLSSKLEDKEAKLSDVRDREGVLTTTISHYRDRIERLTDEVAVLRGQEAAVQAAARRQAGRTRRRRRRTRCRQEAPRGRQGPAAARPGGAARAPRRDL